VERWLNGVRVAAANIASAEFQQATAQAPARTRRALDYKEQQQPLALQSHTGMVWVRNIKLRRLPVVP
jgi:hypothetical protein